MTDDPSIIIAQVSDFHTTVPGRTIHGIDPAAGVKRCVDALNALTPRPALIVISGDIAESGAVEEYRHARHLLSALEIPYLVVPGNHDAREPMREVFADQPYAHASGSLDTAIAAGGLDVLLLDSSVAGQSHGMLEPQTLDWLGTTLAAGKDRPAMVFLHHPPLLTGIAAMDKANLSNADALAAVFKQHPRVRLVAAGHVHRCVSTMFAGLRATICPSVNHAVALDLGERLPLSYIHETPGFHLHCWFGDGGDVVTHTVPIGTFDGPHHF